MLLGFFVVWMKGIYFVISEGQTGPQWFEEERSGDITWKSSSKCRARSKSGKRCSLRRAIIPKEIER